MKQEVIQDFLNLPGIEGLALMDGHSRPYFCGVDQGLNFQQKQALVQGIQQVIETTPITYQCFQFQFGNHQVYVHKLSHGLILLVLTSSALGYTTYQQSLSPLTSELQSDAPSAIANFRLIAGQTHLDINYAPTKLAAPTNLPSHNSQDHVSPSEGTHHDSDQTPLPESHTNDTEGSPSHAKTSSLPPSGTSPQPSLFQQPNQAPNNAAVTIEDVSVEEFLHAINELLHLSAEYLGKTMVKSYWKSSRPPLEWLSNFEIGRSGRLTITSSAPVVPKQSLSTEQQQWFREWVTAFIERCGRIIRDFDKVALHLELDSHQKTLLFNRSLS